MSYIFKVSKWEGSPLGKEILTYFWCAWVFWGGGGWSDLVLSAALRPAKSQCCPTQRLIPKAKGETTLKATLEDLGPNNITLLTCPVNRWEKPKNVWLFSFDTSKPWIPSAWGGGGACWGSWSCRSILGTRCENLWFLTSSPSATSDNKKNRKILCQKSLYTCKTTA